MKVAVVCALLLLTFLSRANAAIESGTVSSEDGFAFLSKFCFQTGEPAGTYTVSAIVPDDQTDIVLLSYDDQEYDTQGSWSKILDHWDDWNCDVKSANAKLPYGLPAARSEPGPNGETTLYWQTTGIQQHARPRYWFFAFSRCGPGGLSSAEYRIHFEQNSDSWNREFGYNENGMNTLYLSFFLILTVVIGINCFSVYRLQQKLSYLHPLIKLFFIILIIEYFSMFILLIHYGSYASNGEGIVLLLKLGQVLAIVSRCLFMMLLLLLAKGWTISRETLTHKWAIIGIVLSYLGLSIFILVYSYSNEDPKLSSPSKTDMVLTIILNIIWLAFAVWYLIQIFFYSYRGEDNPHKRSMFLKLGVIFGLWFLLPPLAQFAAFALDPWARDRVIAVFTVGISTLAYMILVGLFWHSRAEDAFSIATPDVMVGSRINTVHEGYAHL